MLSCSVSSSLWPCLSNYSTSRLGVPLLPGNDDFVVDLGCDKLCILRNGDVLTNQLCGRITPTKISFSLQDFARRLFGADARYTKDYLTLHGYFQLLGLESTNSKVKDYIEYYALHDHVGNINNRIIFKWLKECDLVNMFTIEHAVAVLLLYIKYEFMINRRNNLHRNQPEDQEFNQTTDICLSKLSIIVPNEWNDRQKRSLLLAYKFATIEAGRLIPSGTALAMQYATSKKPMLPSKENPASKYVLFIDIGQSQCTLTLVLYSFRTINDSKERTNHIRIVNSLASSDHISGMNIIRLIHDILVEKYEKIYSKTPEKHHVVHAMKGKIFEEINEIKRSFSLGAKEVRVSIDRFYDHQDFNVTIAKEEFESRLATLILPLKEQFTKIINEAHIDISNIYEVELVGGSTRLPSVRDFIDKNLLYKSKRAKTSLNADEGAALGGSSIISNSNDFSLHDVLYYNYYIQINDQEYTKLYKRGDQMCHTNKKQIRTEVSVNTSTLNLVILSSVSGEGQFTTVSTYTIYPPKVEVASIPLVINFAIDPVTGIVYVQNVECEVGKQLQQVHSRLRENDVLMVNKVRQIEGKVREATVARDIKVNRRNDIESMLLYLKKRKNLPAKVTDLITTIDSWLDEAVYMDKQMEEYDEYFALLRSIHNSM